MGQILIVHGGEAADVAALLDRGVRCFERLGDARPDARRLCGATGFASWRRRASRPAPVSTGNAGTPRLADAAGAAETGSVAVDWVLTAGCWLFEGRADPAAVERLGAALRAPTTADPDAWSRAAARLDGFFAVAAGDGAGRDLAVAVDRTGSTHLYRTRVGRSEVLSTSSLVLAALSGAAFDALGLLEFLGTGSVFEQRSLHEGVEKLPAASLLRFRDGRLVARERWWTLRPLLWGSSQALDRPGDIPSLAAALTAALDGLLAAYPGAALDLTGGFDSRAVLGAALATGRPFRTVVVGAEGDPDVVAAGRIAQAFGLTHTHLAPGRDYGARGLADLRAALALCDGEADVVEYAGIAQIQARMAGGSSDGATINGSSGELCRGYWWDLLPSLGASGRAFDSRRAATGRFATDGWADGLLAVGAPPLAEHFTLVVERAVAELRDLPAVALADAIYLDLRMQRWAGRLVSSTDRIWPCISPFMFEGPMRAALGAPPALRRRDRMMRQLIERLSPRLAALPMADGSPALPLRAGTLHRFGPHAAALGGKAWRRMRRKLGASAATPPVSAASATPTGLAAVVARLVADAEVAALLRPDSMRTAALYRPAELARLVAAAKAPGFDQPKRWGRVLTLELLARELERLRADARAGAPAGA